MTSLDLEQRIERAARLLVAYRFGWDEAGDAARLEAERDYWRVRAREVLSAAFPELLSTPPTMWLAPMDAAWEVVRDAHLSTPTDGSVDD